MLLPAFGCSCVLSHKRLAGNHFECRRDGKNVTHIILEEAWAGERGKRYTRDGLFIKVSFSPNKFEPLRKISLQNQGPSSEQNDVESYMKSINCCDVMFFNVHRHREQVPKDRCFRTSSTRKDFAYEPFHSEET